MTMNAMTDSQDRVSDLVLENNPKELLLTSREVVPCSGEIGGWKVSRKILEDTETESGGSSEEMDSPKSVGKWRRDWVHNQVMRIREEDLHLGEDKVTNCETCGAFHLDNHDRRDYHRFYLKPRADMVMYSRPNLPCSPLSGKTSAVKALPV